MSWRVSIFRRVFSNSSPPAPYIARFHIRSTSIPALLSKLPKHQRTLIALTITENITFEMASNNTSVRSRKGTKAQKKEEKKSAQSARAVVVQAIQPVFPVVEAPATTTAAVSLDIGMVENDPASKQAGYPASAAVQSAPQDVDMIGNTQEQRPHKPQGSVVAVSQAVRPTFPSQHRGLTRADTEAATDIVQEGLAPVSSGGGAAKPTIPMIHDKGEYPIDLEAAYQDVDMVPCSRCLSMHRVNACQGLAGARHEYHGPGASTFAEDDEILASWRRQGITFPRPSEVQNRERAKQVPIPAQSKPKTNPGKPTQAKPNGSPQARSQKRKRDDDSVVGDHPLWGKLKLSRKELEGWDIMNIIGIGNRMTESDEKRDYTKYILVPRVKLAKNLSRKQLKALSYETLEEVERSLPREGQVAWHRDVMERWLRVRASEERGKAQAKFKGKGNPKDKDKRNGRGGKS
ncbi:uncharacterized protein BDZ99DRAFT_567782 [Mytilinidion resinicola]|uniref:Uncharacterized protein n=1 Tax=Mytilinidion resinicola TaxID=574789 RepID=A0A6A6Z1I9_9PEZI|nr:uncharacterized protein BDZ99DRAFT_567782 [Mytilinidion resinicola]KAF2814097.1 hypothetical protein BDZ99DRAFT_567782 [Mytilinidion resinicola]